MGGAPIGTAGPVVRLVAELESQPDRPLSAGDLASVMKDLCLHSLGHRPGIFFLFRGDGLEVGTMLIKERCLA